MYNSSELYMALGREGCQLYLEEIFNEIDEMCTHVFTATLKI